MYGVIIGDIIGSIYELHNDRRKDINIDDLRLRFTVDTIDTILTVATMHAIMNPELGYSKSIKEYFRIYKDSKRGFGCHFVGLGKSDTLESCNSFNNGSDVRVSSFARIKDPEEVLLKEMN